MDGARQLIGKHRIDHTVALHAGPALKSVGDNDYIEVRFTGLRQTPYPGVACMFMRLVVNLEFNRRERG